MALAPPAHASGRFFSVIQRPSKDAAAQPSLSEFVADVPPPRSPRYNHTIGAIKSGSVAPSSPSAPPLTYVVLHFSPNVTEFFRRRFKLGTHQ